MAPSPNLAFQSLAAAAAMHFPDRSLTLPHLARSTPPSFTHLANAIARPSPNLDSSDMIAKGHSTHMFECPFRHMARGRGGVGLGKWGEMCAVTRFNFFSFAWERRRFLRHLPSNYRGDDDIVFLLADEIPGCRPACPTQSLAGVAAGGGSVFPSVLRLLPRSLDAHA